MWGPVTNPTARTLASWRCPLCRRPEGARGGHLLPGRGPSGVGRSSIPDSSSFGACGRGPLPTGYGCEGCGRGDPSPNPQRALLRAGFACCGGGRRAPGAGGSCLRVEIPGLGALPSPTARPLGRPAGAHYPLALGMGCVGVETHDQPDCAHSCQLALCTVRATQGRLGWTPLAWAWGVRGRVLFHPRPLVLWGVRPGPTTQWLWVRAVWAWGPVTNPQRALLRAGLARCGGGTRAPGGGASCLGVGHPGSGALPTPTACPLERAARANYPLTDCGCGVWGRRGPPPTPQSALLQAGLDRSGGSTRAPRGGAPLALVWGVQGSGALPPPTTRLLGAPPGPNTH